MDSFKLAYKESIIYLLGKVALVKKSEYYSEKELKILQRKRFENIVKYAMKNSKFYREYYGDYNISEEAISNMAVNEFPKINKTILMENFESVLTENDLTLKEAEQFLANEESIGEKYRGKYRLIHTSGSSGKIGIFVYDSDGWQTLKAMVLTRVSQSSLFHLKREKITFIGATAGHYAGVTLASSVPPIFYQLNKVNINRPIEEVVSKINLTNPDILTGYSSGVYMLAKLQSEGKIDIAPKIIICSADPMTKGMREEITSVFGVVPITFYASSESICMAAQQRGSDEIQLFNDFHIFELVDQNENYVKDDEPGRVILTNLYNYVQPLIRYEMNDELIIGRKKWSSSNEAKQSWNFPVLKQISGRSEEFLWLKKSNGETDYIHPCIMAGYYVPGLEKYQIVQDTESSFIIKAVLSLKIHSKESILKMMNDKMMELLSEKGFLGEVGFKIEIVENIAVNEKTGKVKLIILLKK